MSTVTAITVTVWQYQDGFDREPVKVDVPSPFSSRATR
jgi:hypothetical protein